MTRPHLLFPLLCLAATAAAQDAAPAPAVPEKAARYHEALLRRPHNAALFDRFFGAWLDERPVDALGGYLAAEAAGHGGAHWTVLAAYRLRRGEEDGALAALGQGIAALPDDPALALERGKLRLRRLEFGPAREDFARVAAGADEALAREAAKLAGKAWLREGKTAEAVRAWDAVLAARPGDEDLLEDLVETAAAEGETAQALAYCDKLVAATRDPYRKTLRELRRGDLLVQAGRHDEAVAAYAATLGRTGAGSWLEREVLAQIDKAFRRQDRLGDLLAELEKLAAAYPQRLLVHRQLARLEAARGDTDAAIGRFREVLRRSPGEREPREEFVRLLTDTERYGDAAAELGKLAELSPADAGLQLQLAALRARQDQPAAVLEALEKARVLLGNDESAGLRVAGLMLQYNLAGQGDDLLRQLAAAPGASPAALEALAARHGAAGRKEEALALLKRAGAGDDPDILLRATGTISALGETAAAHDILAARAAQFSGEPRFLAALAQAALAAGRPAAAVPQALKLVRLARQPGELAEAVQLATRVLAGAGDAAAIRDTLAARTDRAPGETCLLAALAEDAGDFEAVAKSLGAAPDPLLIRFHAALLDRRGDFPAAIAVLTRLGDTAEGKQAAYFKDLAELQQRAGQTAAALATVGRWKLAAPGDKAAWLAGSRLQRDSGKPDEAARTLRQAVGRFEGDADLAASLAALHDEAGQWAEAEAIYWKLYDDAPAPADQARWAAQLAQLALKTGRAGELEEQLRERARNNRQAIGPLLALAELARVNGNDGKVLGFLSEAARLQPRNLELRLRIANVAEETGHPREALAALEEAVAFDSGGRVRSALAQLYFRQGEPAKAMRQLSALAGNFPFDPRAAESAAVRMAEENWTDEAVRFLQDELSGDGDWRTRYLLATLLENDGREAEALPIFLGLLDARGEIAGMPQPVVTRQTTGEPLSPDALAVLRTITASRTAYARLGAARYSPGVSQSRPARPRGTPKIDLPGSAAEVRQLALAHVCKLAKWAPGGDGAGFEGRVRAAADGDFDLARDLAGVDANVQVDLVALLEKHPDTPGLFELVTAQNGIFSQHQVPGTRLVRRVLAGKTPSLAASCTAWSMLATGTEADDPAWRFLIDAAKRCLAARPAGKLTPLTASLRSQLEGPRLCPEIHRPAFRQLLLDDVAAAGHPRDDYSLGVVALAGTPDQWLAEIDAGVRDFREKPAVPRPADLAREQIAAAAPRPGVRMRVLAEAWPEPALKNLPFGSVPTYIVWALLSDVRAGEPESPLLRAILAVKSGDAAAIAKALEIEPPPAEAADFELLRAVVAVDPLATYKSLRKARAAAGNDREWVAAIDVSLLAATAKLTPDDLAARSGELRAALLECRQIFGPPAAHALTVKAMQLGYEDLAKRLAPAAVRVPPPVVLAVPPPISLPGAARTTPQALEKFVAAGKFEAAARAVLRQFRDSGATVGTDLPDLPEILGPRGAEELLRIAAPGGSKSLRKRLEYVSVCEALGRPQLAVVELEAILKDRPGDPDISARLVFSTAGGRSGVRAELLERAAASADFAGQLDDFTARLKLEKTPGAALDFFETVAVWLESGKPAAAAWVAVAAKNFYLAEFTPGVPSLFVATSSPDAMAARQREIGKRLATAMIRNGACADEGFRLLAAARAWSVEPAEMDRLARAVLLAEAGGAIRAGFFPGAKGVTFPEYSAGVWLGKRLGNAGEIFPADFIAELRRNAPEMADFVALLAKDLQAGDLDALWHAAILGPPDSRRAELLKPLMLGKLESVPGSAEFLAARVEEIVPGSVVNRYGTGAADDAERWFAAAIRTAGPGEIDGLARSICRAVFGGKPRMPAGDSLENLQPHVDFMGNVARQLADDPAAMVRCQGAFLRLGVPLGTSADIAAKAFASKRFDTAEEAEKFLESLGWLTDAETWEPYVVLVQDRKEHTVRPVMVFARAPLVFGRGGYPPADLVERLAARQTGRFGSLMTAAALSSGAERTALAERAFAEFPAAVAGWPRERVELLRPWLDGAAGAK